MNEEQTQTLGQLLRRRREELGLSSRDVSQQAGINQATVVRLEQGSITHPDPDKLRHVAMALDLNLADVLVMADYPIPTELPSVGPYLRTKYRDLPVEAVDEIQQDVADVLRRYGLEPNGGPVDGEDEAPEDT